MPVFRHEVEGSQRLPREDITLLPVGAASRPASVESNKSSSSRSPIVAPEGLRDFKHHFGLTRSRRVDSTSRKTKYSELCDAVREMDVPAIKRLLSEGASFTQRADGAGPLHLWNEDSCDCHRASVRLSPSGEKIQPRNMDSFKEMLVAAVESDNKSNVLDCRDGKGRTPLYMAIESGYLEFVKVLVEAGASLENVSFRGDTALHVAAQCHNILRYFLDNYNIPNYPNKFGNAPIHYAARAGDVGSMKLLLEKYGNGQLSWRNHDGSTVLHEAARFDSIEIVQFLAQFKPREFHSILNAVNKAGETALYKSAKCGHEPLAALLLNERADLSVNTEKETAIKKITTEFTDPLTFFEDVLDTFIYQRQNSVYVDYKVLSNSNGEGMSQIKLIEELVRCGQSKLLKHPVIESLIRLKWKCLLPVFCVIIATYVIFLVAFNVFIITSFTKIDKPSSSCIESYEGHCRMLTLFVYMSITALFIQECIWICLRRRRYFVLVESWVTLSGLTMAALVPALVGCAPAPAPAPAPWQRHVACAALLLAWLQAMLLLARSPGWGYYVHMFERVVITVLKILVTSICLVFGFSICFTIQYESKPPFDGPVAAFVKTLVMMSSEFDYEDLFDKTQLNDTETVRLLFVMFVILIAIALMNFITGVAVSDINELRVLGNVKRLEKQVELLSNLEALGDTILGKWCPRLSRIRFQGYMSRRLSEPGGNWTVHAEHGPYMARRFTTKLEKAIVSNIARKKRQTVNKLDALYDALVDAPHNPKYNAPLGYPNSSIRTLKERVKAIEDANQDMKHSMEKILEMLSSEKISADKRVTFEVEPGVVLRKKSL